LDPKLPDEVKEKLLEDFKYDIKTVHPFLKTNNQMERYPLDSGKNRKYTKLICGCRNNPGHLAQG
jgi:hypothetical protein